MGIQNIIFVLSITAISSHDWLLYGSIPRLSAQSYDCLLLESIWYCRRPTNFSLTSYSNSRCPEKNKRFFSDLATEQKSPEELLNWLVPTDIAEHYASYLSLNSSLRQSANASFFCNCTSSTFGVNCEYQLPEISTPVALLKRQLTDQTMVSFLDQWCLVDIPCHMGLSCLDWRYVCDGIEQCQFGEDEVHCERLEENECETTEYRCRNGLCIPQEWFFDAIFDCQDESDEHRIAQHIATRRKCRLSPYNSQCTEHFCSSEQPYSCGDGQCLRWQHLHDQQVECANFRNLFHRCEMKASRVLGTIEGHGSCEQLAPTAEPKISGDSPCIKAFRKLLSNLRGSLAPLEKSCEEYLNFPADSLISPNVYTRFQKSGVSAVVSTPINHEQRKSMIAYLQSYCFNGSITCNGVVTTLNETFCLSFEEILERYDQWPFRYIVCLGRQQPKTVKSSRLWQCPSSQRWISKWRINDGHRDCLNGEDEFVVDNRSTNRPYRYRCASPVPVQYVSTNQLGDGERNCQDGSDEISSMMNWNALPCLQNDLYTCEILRNDERIRQVRLRFHLHCNSIWDTWDGNDESNCAEWICPRSLIRCNQTGQCIKLAWFCDGEWDCGNGEDELNCSIPAARFSLENHCNHTNEFFCITSSSITNPASHRPCIPYSQAGDGREDCLGARDERNTIRCEEDNKVLGDRFRCANGTCLPAQMVCNGVKDCEEGTDEHICYWIDRTNRSSSSCPSPQFQCLNGKCVSLDGCKKRNSLCTDNEDLFWCPESNNIYRREKLTTSNYDDFCMSKEENASSPLEGHSNPVYAAPIHRRPSVLVCNQGLLMTNPNIVCFCPPNHYGDRCQYFTRRIPIRISLDRLHRTDLNKILHIHVFLLCNHTRLIDYTQVLDSIKHSQTKHDRYLLYTRPKLSCPYHVRFEAFHSTLPTVRLLAVWEYPIHFDFLPSSRLAKVLRFPLRESHSIPLLCTHSICQNNGTCHLPLNQLELMDGFVCQCSLGFYGRYCEKRMNASSCPCASPAQCRVVEHGIVDVRQDWLCICPEGFLPPYCRLKNVVCSSHPCLHNGTCYAHAEIGFYTCICNEQYRGEHCEKSTGSLTIYTGASKGKSMHFSNAFLLQLYGIRRGFLVLRQHVLVQRQQLPLTIAFESPLPNTELALIENFEQDVSDVRLALYQLYANCSIETKKHYAMDIFNSIKCLNLITSNYNSTDIYQFHRICQEEPVLQCFYTSHYFCRCDRNLQRAQCVSFHLDLVECYQKSACFNGGQCVHGNRLNRTDFVCICPLCTRGRLCQYTFTRFSLTLETLFVSMPSSYQYHLIISILMFLVGLVFNGFSIFILDKVLHRKAPSMISKKLSFGACSVYLLIKSITSQMTLVFLLLRIIYLSLSKISQLNYTTNASLCKGLPYIMSSLWFVSSWMTAFVTITRSISIVRPKSCLFMRSSEFALRVVLINILIVFLSYITYPVSYKIVIDTTGKQLESWCVLELSASNMSYLQSAAIVHQLVPFLFNVIATILLLFSVSRNKANLHHQGQLSSFVHVLSDRLELLLGPLIGFITQLPQIIMLFFDSCQFANSYSFTIGTLIAYYLTFVPQMAIFFMYILPSPLYKEELQKISLFKPSE